MKKLFLALCIVTASLNLNAQDTQAQENQTNFNEVKLNALFMVVGAFNVTYERTLNEESGVGLEVFLPFDKDIKDDIDYYISPYYRFYFGKKYAAGFFLEGFGMLSEVTVEELFFLDNQGNITGSQLGKETNVALGIGVGGKWVTNKGFIGELSVGVGRNLLESNFDNEAVGKIGITLGYRF